MRKVNITVIGKEKKNPKKIENKDKDEKFEIVCDFLRYLRMHTISYKNHDGNKRFENKWKTKKSNKLPNIVFVYSFCCLN